ncbi:7tm 6 domain containing protein, partial [Asbolus verrucosus]
IYDANRSIFDRIRKESNRISGILLLNMIVALACSVLYMLPDDNDDEIFFIFHFIKENALKWNLTISWIIRAHYPLIAHMLMFSIRFYLFHVANHIKKLNEGTGEEFQMEIKSKLIFCVERHINIIKYIEKLVFIVKKVTFLDFRLFNKLNSFLSNFILFFAVSGGKNFQRLIVNIYCRVATMACCTGITFVTLTVTGQMMEAETENIFNHLKCQNWYNWSHENKRLYLIFLSGAVKPLRIQFSDSVGINYELAKS